MSINLRLSSSASGTRNTFDRTLNFVTDFGGVSGGSQATNNAAAAAFNTAYAGFTGRTQLVVPPGPWNITTGFAPSSGSVVGGSRLTVSAYGATFQNLGGIGVIGGTFNDNAHNAPFTTTSASASTVALVSSGQTSLFTAGRWVLLTGIDMQGYGYPQNPGLFEFKQIQSIGSGTITFTAPLVNSYKDTWPNYAPGDGVNLNQGGPGNIYVLRDGWDQEIEFQGATFSDVGGLIYNKCRVALWTDCTFATYGPCPSNNILYRSLRCTGAGTGGLEIDKVCERVEFIDSMHRAVDFQSASINDLYVSNMVQTGSSLRWRGGAGKTNTFVNCSFGAFSFDEMNYGQMGATSMTNCSATSGDWFIQKTPMTSITEEGGGVLSYTGGPTPPIVTHYWAVPGQNCILVDASNNWARSFQVSDVTSSAGKTFVTTNLPFPIPSTINGRNAPWSIASHPCPSVTMTNCTGNSLFTTHSGLPAGTPFQSWTL